MRLRALDSSPTCHCLLLCSIIISFAMSCEQTATGAVASAAVENVGGMCTNKLLFIVL
jgi:hypothetical protein